MNVNKLHTELLENLFGPIRLVIAKQENELRIVHLYDPNNISRTLGVVRFKNYNTAIIKETHKRILQGELLGKTLMEAKIPCVKSYVSTVNVELPEWLKEDFNTTNGTTSAVYSQITIFDQVQNKSFLYAELFEIIPPDIIHLVPNTKENFQDIDKEMRILLGYADVTVAPNDKNL
ncbi:MAG: hypothetical protein HKN52_11480 [Eudoraea sp.]|nr:hypothetical protein [Eudoraea sp.]